MRRKVLLTNLHWVVVGVAIVVGAAIMLLVTQRNAITLVTVPGAVAPAHQPSLPKALPFTVQGPVRPSPASTGRS